MKDIALLSLRYLVSRPLTALLNLLLLSLGLASITFVLLVSAQLDQAFERDLAGIDAVVGAKGSPMQLILSGVFHIDVPPGNVPLADVQALAANPQVAQVIPLSLGDSYRGFRIVGTTPDYIAHYGARLAAGTAWAAPLQAVAGAQAAREAALAPGVRFAGSHGLGGGGHAHGDTPYTVAGVLAPCGCVLDRLILTATESVWQVHEKATAVDEEDRKALEAEREVTMALIRYRSPLAAVTFPRFVNTTTDMQAAAPAVEITRLLRMVGVGTDVLRGFGAVLLAAAAPAPSLNDKIVAFSKSKLGEQVGGGECAHQQRVAAVIRPRHGQLRKHGGQPHGQQQRIDKPAHPFGGAAPCQCQRGTEGEDHRHS